MGIDRDSESLEIARARLEAIGFPFRLCQGDFTQIRQFLQEAGISPEGALDGVLFDLGVSSLQLDRAERGFSFMRDGPLDMRMGQTSGASAADFLSRITVEDLTQTLRDYGEEPAAWKVARAIVHARHHGGLKSTLELAAVVEAVLPRRGKKTHPATRTFQAIRIAVNSELESLRTVLRDLDRLLKPGARVVVLSYHSLEDRIVKTILGEQVRDGLYRWLAPSPQRPSADEIRDNPRARSARLRALVRAPAGG
jgi:16S rRNA (cytosine1402-N4)-methyltransferase